MHCHECQQFRRQSFRYHFTVKSLNTKSWHGCRCTRETYFDLKISFSIFKLKNGFDCAKYSLYMCHSNKKSNKYRTFKVVHMTHKKWLSKSDNEKLLRFKTALNILSWIFFWKVCSYVWNGMSMSTQPVVTVHARQSVNRVRKHSNVYEWPQTNREKKQKPFYYSNFWISAALIFRSPSHYGNMR